MKHFRITDLTTGESWQVSSALPGESRAHVAASQHLDLTHRYQIEEIAIQEIYGLPGRALDPDTDDEPEEVDDSFNF